MAEAGEFEQPPKSGQKPGVGMPGMDTKDILGMKPGGH